MKKRKSSARRRKNVSRIVKHVAKRHVAKRRRKNPIAKLHSPFTKSNRHKLTVYDTGRRLRRSPRRRFRAMSAITNPAGMVKDMIPTVIDGAYILGGMIGVDVATNQILKITGIPAVMTTGWGKVGSKLIVAVVGVSLVSMINKDLAKKIGAGAMASVLKEGVVNTGVLSSVGFGSIIGINNPSNPAKQVGMGAIIPAPKLSNMLNRKPF